MLLMQFRALVVDSFREAVEKKLFWIMGGITALIALAMAMVEFTDTHITLFFGLMNPIETDLFAPNTVAGRALIGDVLATQIGGRYIGFVGIVIALVATSGTIPSLMQPGAIDVVLSKPVSRPTLFLGKYAGAMVFVLIQAAWFVVLTFLVVGFRWHYWQPRYLWCIPLTVVLFSYLYAFSALFGVMTRNAMASLLLTGLAWFSIVIPQYAHKTLLQLPAFGMDVGERWVDAAYVARQVVPKTTDIMMIAGNLIGATAATPDEIVLESDYEAADSSSDGSAHTDVMSVDMTAAVKGELEFRDINLFQSIGSSLVFEAVILLIAIYKFSRRDF